jgi:hypothetical protein
MRTYSRRPLPESIVLPFVPSSKISRVAKIQSMIALMLATRAALIQRTPNNMMYWTVMLQGREWEVKSWEEDWMNPLVRRKFDNYWLAWGEAQKRNQKPR